MISKETTISLSLVVVLLGCVFTLGKHSQKLDDVVDEVNAAQKAVVLKGVTDESFKSEVLQRLSRIEEAVKRRK